MKVHHLEPTPPSPHRTHSRIAKKWTNLVVVTLSWMAMADQAFATESISDQRDSASTAIESFQTDARQTTTKLYGRVEQFFAETGPEFPSQFLSAEKNNTLKIKSRLPKELLGWWHGDVHMGRVLILPACTEFSENYSRSIQMIKNCQDGKAALNFENAGSSVELKHGTSLFYFPAVARSDELEQIFSRLINVSEADKERIRQAMAAVSSSFKLEMGPKQSGKEALGYGITGRLKSMRVSWDSARDNTFERESVAEIKVSLRPGGIPQMNYSEAITRFVTQENDKLLVTSACARYGADKQLLWSYIWSGTFERGSIDLSREAGNDIHLSAEADGVLVTCVGAKGEHTSVFVKGASIVYPATE